MQWNGLVSLSSTFFACAPQQSANVALRTKLVLGKLKRADAALNALLLNEGELWLVQVIEQSTFGTATHARHAERTGIFIDIETT